MSEATTRAAEYAAKYNKENAAIDVSGVSLTERETQILWNFINGEWCGCYRQVADTETITAWDLRMLYSYSEDICGGVKNPSGVASSLNKKGLVESYTDKTHSEGPLDCMALTEAGTAKLVSLVNAATVAERQKMLGRS